MTNRKCDWCGHGYPAEMMEVVEVDGKAMLWCPQCFNTLPKQSIDDYRMTEPNECWICGEVLSGEGDRCEGCCGA